MTRHTARTVRTAAGAALVAAGLFTAHAADVSLTASDTAGTTSFNAAGNWSSLAAPTAGNSYFTGAYELWTPEGGTANYTFAGDSLTVGSGGRLIYAGNGAATPPVISVNNWTNSGGLVSSRSGANVNFDKPLRLAGTGNTLGAGSANTNIFAGVISGTAGGGLTIGTGSDAPLVILTNKNTFTGGITVESGATLRADGYTPSGTAPTVNPLGANAITLKAGATIVVRDNRTAANQTSLFSNNLTVEGDAAIGTGNYSGSTPFLVIKLNALAINNSVLSYTGQNGTWGGFSGTTTLSGDATFNTVGAMYLDKVTDGAGTYKIVKNGANGLYMQSAASDYEGGTVLNNGTLGGNSASGGTFGTGDITVNGGTLQLRYNNVAQPNLVKFDGPAELELAQSVNTTFVVKGLALNNGTFTLDRNLAGGTLTLNAPITNTVAVQVNVTGTSAGTLAIGGAGASLTLGGNITFNPTTAPLVINAPIGETGGAYGLTKSGATNLTLAVANSYSGSTTVNAGTLMIGADAALGTVPGSATPGHLTFGGGTLATTASFTLSDTRGIALTGAGTINTAAGTTLDYGGLMAGGGGLTKAGSGTLALSGATTRTGGTTVNAGTLLLSGGNDRLPFAKPVALTPAAAADPATLNVNGTTNTVTYLTCSGAGRAFIRDEAVNAGMIFVTNSFGVSAGTMVVERVGIAHIVPGTGFNGFNVTGSGCLIVSNGAALTGYGGYVANGTGHNSELVIDNATMSQNNTFYISGFSQSGTGTVTVVNGGSFGVTDLMMPWAGGVAGQSGGPSRLNVTKATVAFNSLQHMYNPIDGATKEGVVTLDNATVKVYTATGASIDSNLTVRVRGGGVTFDIGAAKTMTVRSPLSEDAVSAGGGLTKAGAGTLVLANTNTYGGVTTVEAGTLRLGLADTLPAAATVLVATNAVLDINGKVQTLASLGGGGTVNSGSLLTVTDEVVPGGTNAIGTLTLASTPAALSGTFKVDAATDGTGDRLHVQGDLDVTGLTLQVADLAGLNKNKSYVIASWTGSLTGPFISDNLVSPWLIRYDTTSSQIVLAYRAGTMIRLL